jgi:uncharacterized membrane protein (UPF0127 family)
VGVAFSPSGNRIIAYTMNNVSSMEIFYIFNSADGSVFDSKHTYPFSVNNFDYYSRSLLLTDSGAIIIGSVTSSTFTCAIC